ncbi:hypothetical protein ALC53_09142 [Atta colombica]|uniref:Uncharacterized protein n=1 Tax=Atta colombica TaxID=520822 RepID=A0A151I1M3_9HYME|nr:hypothetical protein ALC53_09142 [Atta colombica]
MLHDFLVEIYSAISILLKTAADSNVASQHGGRRPDRFPRKTAPPRDWPRSTNGSASRALRREMAAAYDHSDHNAPAIRHCDVIAYYRTFISCSCVRIRSGVSHVGLPWLRPTQVQKITKFYLEIGEKLWNLRVRGICDNPVSVMQMKKEKLELTAISIDQRWSASRVLLLQTRRDDVIRGRRRLFPTRDVIDAGWEEEEEEKGDWKERRGRMMDVYSYYLQSQFAMEHSCRLKPLGDAVFRGPLIYLDGCQKRLYRFCYHCDMVQLKGFRH